MRGGGGVEVAPDDDALMDEERLARGHAEDERDAKSVGDGVVLIGEKRVGEMVLLLEQELGFGGVAADADDPHVMGLEIDQAVAKAAGLLGAAGGVRFGVEKDQGVAVAVKIGELDLVAMFVVDRYIGSRRADFQGLSLLG